MRRRIGGSRRCQQTIFDKLEVVATITLVLISLFSSDLLLPPFVCSAYSINPKKLFGGIRKVFFPSSSSTTEASSKLPTKEDIDFLNCFNQRVEEETLDWVQSRVIKLNLCPFADKPLNKDKRLTIHIVRGENPGYIAQEMFNVISQVMDDITNSNPQQMMEGRTALVVTPDFSPTDFDSFLLMVQALDIRILEPYNLDEHIQIVPFHPKLQYDYVGDGPIDAKPVVNPIPIDDADLPIETITNRSPYPMFHILVQDDVDKATSVQLQGDAGKVWRRNKILLQLLEKKLGRKNAFEYVLGTNHVSTTNNNANNNSNGGKKKNNNNERSLLMKPTDVTDLLKQTKIEFDKQESRLSDHEKQKEKGGWIR